MNAAAMLSARLSNSKTLIDPFGRLQALMQVSYAVDPLQLTVCFPVARLRARRPIRKQCKHNGSGSVSLRPRFPLHRRVATATLARVMRGTKAFRLYFLTAVCYSAFHHNVIFVIAAVNWQRLCKHTGWWRGMGWLYFRHNEETARQAKVLTRDEARRDGRELRTAAGAAGED
jgi:hypothetical protein